MRWSGAGRVASAQDLLALNLRRLTLIVPKMHSTRKVDYGTEELEEYDLICRGSSEVQSSGGKI